MVVILCLDIDPDIFVWSFQVFYHPGHISICRNKTFWTDVRRNKTFWTDEHEPNCSPARPVPCNGNFPGFCSKRRSKSYVTSGSNVSLFEFTETRCDIMSHINYKVILILHSVLLVTTSIKPTTLLWQYHNLSQLYFRMWDWFICCFFLLWLFWIIAFWPQKLLKGSKILNPQHILFQNAIFRAKGDFPSKT